MKRLHLFFLRPARVRGDQVFRSRGPRQYGSRVDIIYRTMYEMIVSGFFDGGDRTGIRIPVSQQRNSAQLMSRMMGDTGYLVKGDEVLEWKVESSIDEDGATVLAGPAFSGLSLDLSIRACETQGAGKDERARAEAAVLDLAGAFAALAQRGCLPREISSCGIMTGADGVLFLPPKIVQLAFAKLPPDERSESVAFLRSGKAQDADSEAVFLLAQIAYRLACGRSAFEAEAKADIPAFTRGGFVPSAQVQPRLHPSLVSRIDASLSQPSGADLPAWVAALRDRAGDGWLGDVDPSKAAVAGKQRVESEERLRREKRRGDFLRKRGGILAAVGISIAILGVVIGSVVVDRGKRPDFSGLGPVALAETYYKAIDSLDGTVLEVTAERSASKADDSLVTNLTVLTKMRMAYERKSPYITATEWVSKGKPALDSGTMVFGITGLTLAPESVGEDSAKLRADYTLWTMSAGREGVSPLPEGRITSDELTLKKGKKGWKIVGIERSEIKIERSEVGQAQ